ncbi:shikimate dehydrogenase [Rhizobium sp. L1K21]|uniref:shikimate dehydrogenase family protein n=1 Tax=Rhizobium sp. L1K21 TaxID=2954933 RepID=UPI0020938854|nr:shikimate dehydrogenase [Rhizobium sp. L1K21]MCO6187655.1 shikimate dehydrogenase [Rhizobium sp. L1K21]
MQITGATWLFPIIGHPVAGVFSPPAFNRYFQEGGIDAVMFGLDIAPAGLDAFWQMMRASSNMLGCSVTYPHKQAAFLAVDGMTDRARRLGALNTIRRENDGRLWGEATDGLAMVHAMEKAGFAPEGRTAHVVGAGGGAGLAIVDCLCEKGITRLEIEELDPDRRENLMRLLDIYWPNVEITASAAQSDILINATTLGKKDTDPLPFSEMVIERALLCCDAVTSPTDTRFVAAARHMGKTIISGDDMGAEQMEVQAQFLQVASTA